MSDHDVISRVLYIDLTNKTFTVQDRPDLFQTWFGGAGAASRLLHEHCPQECDPLSPENPIIFAVGPLTGLFPLASKTVAMFKSPHTGNLGESHCGGRSAVAIRMAGYGAVVITGASKDPVYLAIHGSRVCFRDASALWGMDSLFTAGRIIRENEPAAGLRTIMRIGRAGEQQVSFAGVTTETYRHFGRLGLGAVFGSKKLKAVVVSGKRTLPVTDRKLYRKLYDDIYKKAVGTAEMQKYHDLGTAGNIEPLNELGALPVKNLSAARMENPESLTGEHIAREYLGRRLACSHCPVGCIHIAALREPYEDEPYFYKTSMISYDYEPLYAIGSMLGVTDARDYLVLMDRIEALGLDVMSTGVILAWATEALEKGLITEHDTSAVRLSWGDTKSYRRAAENIVDQPNDFYGALARGVDHASSVYGGQDFALSFGGNEMPGYHTGPGSHVGYIMGARHSHLDNAGYSFDQKETLVRNVTPEELARSLFEEESWRQILSSLVVCFFARKIYTAEVVSQALAVAGYDTGGDRLNTVGSDIYRCKCNFKKREGFSLTKSRIPGRIFETMSPAGMIDEPFVKKALEHVEQLIG